MAINDFAYYIQVINSYLRLLRAAASKVRTYLIPCSVTGAEEDSQFKGEGLSSQQQNFSGKKLNPMEYS